MCEQFKPIIDCAGNREARLCELPLGRDGKVFRLSYLLLMCGINHRLKKCGMQNGLQLETPRSRVCPGDEMTTLPSTTPGEVVNQPNICS